MQFEVTVMKGRTCYSLKRNLLPFIIGASNYWHKCFHIYKVSSYVYYSVDLIYDRYQDWQKVLNEMLRI